jgi:hypothetical protein
MAWLSVSGLPRHLLPVLLIMAALAASLFLSGLALYYLLSDVISMRPLLSHVSSTII